jgi:hypothetical protein
MIVDQLRSQFSGTIHSGVVNGNRIWQTIRFEKLNRFPNERIRSLWFRFFKQRNNTTFEKETKQY